MSDIIDGLVWQLVFADSKEDKNTAYTKLWNLGQEKGVLPASINDLYLARAQGQTPLDFTVPAINLRGMTYDSAQAVFRAAVNKNVGALIFEIARSEIGYTDQSPQEYVGVIIAAALAQGFTGPLFIQGDHFQVKVSDQPGVAKEGEVDKVKELIAQALEAGFYNVDIDASTLVDYAKPDIYDQQQTNFLVSSQLSQYVRSLQPEGITVSLGGEIGHIGGKNSTEEELRAYIKGFKENISEGMIGLSKVSIQTGTHHGGVPLADGSLADVDVDFGTLKNLAQVSRQLGMAGTVQHGASTLPKDYFAQFPASEAVEVHLATGFQNIIMDHPQFPEKLLGKMYDWIDQNQQDEKKEGQTDEQFHYKLRKKAWGPFKKEVWSLSGEIKEAIGSQLEKEFAFMFQALKVENSKDLVSRFVKPVILKK